ncbi:hypothetical protein F0562_012348 [Nyssa sinensis]|uniref:Uncharacterized protein n=1 Tax=Nyssa sinensis TaxID=561372 RepID=A0A5J4ZWA0_9ASTE|nr:hypothetical protein F0562_012348 [Nyssa sinensis]
MCGSLESRLDWVGWMIEGPDLYKSSAWLRVKLEEDVGLVESSGTQKDLLKWRIPNSSAMAAELVDAGLTPFAGERTGHRYHKNQRLSVEGWNWQMAVGIETRGLECEQFSFRGLDCRLMQY